MKTLHQKLAGIAPFIFFPFIIIIRKKKRTIYLFLLFTITSLSGCFLNFYKTNTKPSIDAATVSKLDSENRHFIIHFINSTNGLQNAYVRNDTLYGRLIPV